MDANRINRMSGSAFATIVLTAVVTGALAGVLIARAQEATTTPIEGETVLPDGTLIPMTEQVSPGKAPTSTIQKTFTDLQAETIVRVSDEKAAQDELITRYAKALHSCRFGN